MSFEQHDVVVVGAGPAGLSAARTAARLGFRTLVVERLSAPGDTGRAQYAMITPLAELVGARPFLDGMLYPQVDLWIPEYLITADDTVQRCISPAGHELQTLFAADEQGPSVVVNKTGLLTLMIEQSESAGAEFLFGTEADALLWEDERVVGVSTSAGDIRADVVISAEGAMGRLAEEAGLGSKLAHNRLSEFMLNLELDAPAVREEHLGRIVTLGQRTPWSPQGYATLLLPAVGRAQVTFSGLTEFASCSTLDTVDALLEEYRQDFRVAHLLAGARLSGRSSRLTPVQGVSAGLVRTGFMVAGDVVAPVGRLGVLPAIYLGRQAVFFAAEALDSGNLSAEALSEYDHMYRRLLLPHLAAEARTEVALLQMTDGELNRLAVLLNSFHLPVPFMGSRPPVQWDTLDRLAHRLSLTPNDDNLLQRVLGADHPALALLAGRQPVTAPHADLLTA